MNKRVPTETVIAILKNYKEYITPQAYESLELAYAIQRGIESLQLEANNTRVRTTEEPPVEGQEIIFQALSGNVFMGFYRQLRYWHAHGSYTPTTITGWTEVPHFKKQTPGIFPNATAIDDPLYVKRFTKKMKAPEE